MPSRKKSASKAPQPKRGPRQPAGKPPRGKPMSSAATSANPVSVTFIVVQMLFCLVGINLCFGWWSVKQERVVKKPYVVMVKDAAESGAAGRGVHAEKVFLSTTYGITLTQTFTGFLVSATVLGLQNLARRCTTRRGAGADAVSTADPQRSTKPTLHEVPELFVMGFSNISGTSLGYAAMRRLSYPVTLTAKMCKMMPVMFVGSIWHHVRYPLRKVLSCFFITGGVVIFALLDQHGSGGSSEDSAKTVAKLGKSSSSSVVGMALMIVNLLLDGYTNSTQDVLVKRHRWSGASLMMWTNLVSVVCATLVLAVLECGEEPWMWLCSFADVVLSSVSSNPAPVARGVVTAGLSFLPFHDFSQFVSFLARCKEARDDVLLMAVLNAVGQLFIFHTISVFGTLTVTAMTLLRKAGSVLLSIYVHHHPVQPSQWAALVTILVGIVSEGYINVQDASQRQKQRAASSLHRASAAATSVSAVGKAPAMTRSPPTISSSSSTAMMTDSRSATPACAPVERSSD